MTKVRLDGLGLVTGIESGETRASRSMGSLLLFPIVALLTLDKPALDPPILLPLVLVLLL